jgi:anaerobic nitric oxide reductase transcription regulator
MAQTETIIGCKGGLKVVLERAQVVASSDLPVLIFGETGTGKEVVARSIHERSPRRKLKVDWRGFRAGSTSH